MGVMERIWRGLVDLRTRGVDITDFEIILGIGAHAEMVRECQLHHLLPDPDLVRGIVYGVKFRRSFHVGNNSVLIRYEIEA